MLIIGNHLAILVPSADTPGQRILSESDAGPVNQIRTFGIVPMIKLTQGNQEHPKFIHWHRCPQWRENSLTSVGFLFFWEDVPIEVLLIMTLFIQRLRREWIIDTVDVRYQLAAAGYQKKVSNSELARDTIRILANMRFNQMK